MRIWLDMASTSQFLGDKCGSGGGGGGSGGSGGGGGNDCSRNTLDNDILLLMHQSSVTRQRIQTCTLRQAASLYMLDCGDDRWLVCQPTESGRMVVVDKEALARSEERRVG